MRCAPTSGAARRPRPGFDESRLPPPRSAGSWVAAGALTESGIKEAGRLEDGTGEEAAASGLAATLTKAQLAVAELVGRGLTSKEIAETLFLSPRTVDNHLFQIYRRLDITSRAKLAALMADAG
jgi:DNA-binding NarL/FixJ family response regulator